MSYERMWDPEPPTREEKLAEEIKAGGGRIVSNDQDIPQVDHWLIFRFGIFPRVDMTCISYSNKDLWTKEVKRLAESGESFRTVRSVNVGVKVNVSVDVRIDA